jgi:hypothetical protein
VDVEHQPMQEAAISTSFSENINRLSCPEKEFATVS